MDGMVFIASSFCLLDSAGNIPCNISRGNISKGNISRGNNSRGNTSRGNTSRGNASEEVQVAYVGGFQASSDQAGGVVQCWVKFLGMG